MQLKRQSAEAWLNENHYSEGNNTSGTQSQGKKFQISRPCEVRRSGQVTTFVVCAVFSLSFQAVVLLTKNAIVFNVLALTLFRMEYFVDIQAGVRCAPPFLLYLLSLRQIL